MHFSPRLNRRDQSIYLHMLCGFDNFSKEGRYRLLAHVWDEYCMLEVLKVQSILKQGSPQLDQASHTQDAAVRWGVFLTCPLDLPYISPI